METSADLVLRACKVFGVPLVDEDAWEEGDLLE